MPEPPQLALLDVEEQWLYSECHLGNQLLNKGERKLISVACTRLSISCSILPSLVNPKILKRLHLKKPAGSHQQRTRTPPPFDYTEKSCPYRS